MEWRIGALGRAGRPAARGGRQPGRAAVGLLAWALERMEEDDGKGAISVWLNAALAWPNAAFRDRTVTFTTTKQDPDTLAKIRKELPCVRGVKPRYCVPETHPQRL